MRIRRPFLLAGLALLLATGLLLGERRMPTGPDGWGESKQGDNQGQTLPDEFLVATFNIHGCKGTDGIRDVGRVAECLGNPDIAGLQEVHGRVWSSPTDQATQLANLANQGDPDCVFAPAETQWFGTKRFGNGLLSRLPVLAWQRIPLPRRYDRSCRNMLLAHLGTRDQSVSVLVTHLARADDRERTNQLESVLALFSSLDPPAILLADLNTAPGDPQMEKFLAESDAVDAIEAGGVAENDRVDWILIRGLRCLESQRIDQRVSDHPLFTARLSLPRQKCIAEETLRSCF